MKNLLDYFKCSKCNAVGQIELIIEDAVISIKLEKSDYFPEDFEYQNAEIHDESNSYWQCGSCGHKTEEVENSTHEGLYNYLNNFREQEEKLLLQKFKKK